MKLFIKQKVFSIKSKFNIFSENGETKYEAQGELFSLGRKLHVTDFTGNEVIFIKQKLVTFLPKFEITVFGQPPVEIKKNFTLFKHEYEIPAWNVVIKGDFTAHEYSVFQNENLIAKMSKEWLAWGDTYTLDIPEPSCELIALASILVVDCCMEMGDNN